jgi:septin family protein
VRDELIAKLLSSAACPPFSIINPVDEKIVMTSDGKKRKLEGRQYPFGFCDAFDDSLSDFNRLYKLILSNSLTL